MTVGFLSPEKKEGETKLKDFIPAPTPSRKKKAVGTACCLGVTGALCLVAFAIGLTLTFVLVNKSATKMANIKCDGDCNDKYDCAYHGHRGCDDYHQETEGNPVMHHVGGQFPDYQEWIKLRDNVYYVEISSRCNSNRDVTYVTMDMNTGYTAIKTEMRDGHGMRRMLFDNEAILGDRLTSVSSYEFENPEEEFDLHVDTILSGFYKYGEPVPVDRDYLGQPINDMCPRSMHFYYMIAGEESFRSQVEDLMDAYNVVYDDIFDWFVDIYIALNDANPGELSDRLDEWDEILGFFPDGDYSDTSPSGVGWSLNIQSTTWYWYDVTVTVATFSWTGTLVPPSDNADDDNGPDAF